ncbi:hypothetical protein JN11_00229 [Mucilaginibacter frigoritolerans]|uniref:Xaa-Pro dipeptidyl-peptidase C-terminal domain-containing protein n=1 Tax=Mucilaginibacter frigoritolerans TaxID=652788 RepID=A0A562UFE0_9SPHI|nr:CocE/NonD family hydrolase [Mucilaginibacter frigoritolerans]TWJ04520.1 hypothetical protein JN11_00229 [Mucilaginibacter frigoritolerans]
MRKIYLLAFILFPFLSRAQNADSTWFINNYTKKEVTIPMRDGVKLFASVYLPKDNAEKHPILMERTPYSCAPYGKEYRAFWVNHLIKYCRKGYIMVIEDVRGRWMSEGVYKDVRPFVFNKKTKKDIDEASDTYDTIDWMVKNLENNNGKVGVFGISYPGFYSTMASLSGHPALKAVSPEAPVTDWFVGDDFHHNGAFFQMDAFAFYKEFGFGMPHPKPTPFPAPTYNPPIHDNYQFYLKEGLPGLTKLAGDSLVFWNQIMNHPNRDTFWMARNARVGIKDVKPAMLVVGGIFDAEDCFGAWNVYKAIDQQSPATNNRLVMGPWYHEQWRNNDGTHLGNVPWGSNTSEYYANNIEIPFFDYYLRGVGSVDSISKATVFFTGEDKWHQLKQWPPADVQPTAIYLKDKGKLSFTVDNTAKPTFDTYISDPAKPVPYTQDVHYNRTRNYMTDDQRFASRRTDVLAFETDTLTSDLTLAGPVVADLMVSLSNTDADFVVKVIDVFPDNGSYNDVDIYAETDPVLKYPMGGYQMLVRAEIMRGRYRNSYSNPEAFVPGKPTQVKYTLPDVAHTFKKGHRLMIQVQSSWFPLVDRNPQQFIDIYHAKEDDFIKETINVYHDLSKIILPVVK